VPEIIEACQDVTAKARAVAIPDQQCTGPAVLKDRASGKGALHWIRDTSHGFAK
jgi:hypothetical protein